MLEPSGIYAAVLAKLSALEARVEELEARIDAFEHASLDGICAALDEEDPDEFWIGGTDGPDD